ncbi:MAG: hypothetical protein R3E95_09960 [Thiolinea sp.]
MSHGALQASEQLLPELLAYDEVIASNFGLRMQKRLSDTQAKEVAACMSHHRDISLNF